ncbi:hypothetical protein [Mixta sp. Marseille-Q2659]|uniref:hypothetical protein n=1 Tax=Mixta sp. Marseille-Q2659 TaxID=2736607 RepID=UPI0023B98E21|nr:hypothetical protein [Mixta sp. Marseille-Q2659]
MGKFYYVNKSANSSRIQLVHTGDCPLLPALENRTFLGTFYAPLDAIKQAKKFHPQATGCERCCPTPLKKRKNSKTQTSATAQLIY